MTADELRLGSASVLSHSSVSASIHLFDTAIEKVTNVRSMLGSYQNRLIHAAANLDNTSENTTSAESRIRDTDIVKEMVTFAKNNILLQSSQAIFSQGNKMQEQILALLR